MRTCVFDVPCHRCHSIERGWVGEVIPPGNSGVVAYSPLGGQKYIKAPPPPNNTTVNLNKLVYYIRVHIRGGEL